MSEDRPGAVLQDAVRDQPLRILAQFFGLDAQRLAALRAGAVRRDGPAGADQGLRAVGVTHRDLDALVRHCAPEST